VFRYEEHHVDHKDKSGNSDTQRNCRDLLSKVHNALQRDVELSFQTVIAATAGFPERYRSHTFHNVILAPFLHMLVESDLDCAGSDGESSPASGAPSGDSLMISDVNGQRTLSNQRMDYTLRPAGLDDCSLYDFVGHWEKQPWGNRRSYMDWTEEDIEKSMETDYEMPRKPISHAQFRFLPSHSQHHTHGLSFRMDHDQHVVVIKGPTFPSRETDPSRFAQMVLLLFKPFRNLAELRGSDSWITALERFEVNAPSRVKFYVQNIEELRNRQIAWEEDVVLRPKNTNIPSQDDEECESDHDSEMEPVPASTELDSDSDDGDGEPKNSLSWIAPVGRNSEKLTQAYLVAQEKKLFLSCASDCVTAEEPKGEVDHKGQLCFA